MDGEVIVQAAGTRAERSLAARLGRGGVPRVRAARILSASSLIAALAVIAMAVTLVTSAIGFGLAQRSDEQLWAEQRAALRNAVSEFRQLFARPGEIDPRFLRMVGLSARLQGLKFESYPPPGAREMQPVVDAQGRIAGFFTWDETHRMTVAMNRLMPLIAGIAALLVGFAGFALRQLKRARRELAVSEELARRAADEDKITKLPKHAKMINLLDLALAERTGDEIVTFARDRGCGD